MTRIQSIDKLHLRKTICFEEVCDNAKNTTYFHSNNSIIFTTQFHASYGSVMPGRYFSGGTGYRFGFNGQIKDDEIYGSGNAISFNYRVHDARLGRFLSVDPLTKDYPWNSCYAFAENDVIRCIDLEGAEKLDAYIKGKITLGTTTIKLVDAEAIIKIFYDFGNSKYINFIILTNENTLVVGKYNFETKQLEQAEISENYSASNENRKAFNKQFENDGATIPDWVVKMGMKFIRNKVTALPKDLSKISEGADGRETMLIILNTLISLIEKNIVDVQYKGKLGNNINSGIDENNKKYYRTFTRQWRLISKEIKIGGIQNYLKGQIKIDFTEEEVVKPKAENPTPSTNPHFVK